MQVHFCSSISISFNQHICHEKLQTDEVETLSSKFIIQLYGVFSFICRLYHHPRQFCVYSSSRLFSVLLVAYHHACSKVKWKNPTDTPLACNVATLHGHLCVQGVWKSSFRIWYEYMSKYICVAAVAIFITQCVKRIPAADIVYIHIQYDDGKKNEQMNNEKHWHGFTWYRVMPFSTKLFCSNIGLVHILHYEKENAIADIEKKERRKKKKEHSSPA